MTQSLLKREERIPISSLNILRLCNIGFSFYFKTFGGYTLVGPIYSSNYFSSLHTPRLESIMFVAYLDLFTAYLFLSIQLKHKTLLTSISGNLQLIRFYRCFFRLVLSYHETKKCCRRTETVGSRSWIEQTWNSSWRAQKFTGRHSYFVSLLCVYLWPSSWGSNPEDKPEVVPKIVRFYSSVVEKLSNVAFCFYHCVKCSSALTSSLYLEISQRISDVLTW